jgi:hypothetical protein
MNWLVSRGDIWFRFGSTGDAVEQAAAPVSMAPRVAAVTSRWTVVIACSWVLKITAPRASPRVLNPIASAVPAIT